MTQSYLDLTREISAGIQQLRADIPDTLRGFSAMAQAAGKPGVLDAKTKERQCRDEQEHKVRHARDQAQRDLGQAELRLGDGGLHGRRALADVRRQGLGRF